MADTAGFVPPPYPYDRLDRLVPVARALDGGVVDLSIGTPCDPPIEAVIAALSTSNAERGSPPSIGSDVLREAIRAWLDRRFDLDVPLSQVAACVGTKELVATTPHYLRLRTPAKDTVLFPAIAYPTYEMGATLAGCRAVPAPCRADGGLDVSAISDADAARALMLWVNSPSNPTGALTDLGRAGAEGPRPGGPVCQGACSARLTGGAPPRPH